jgi:hypothetical protein
MKRQLALVGILLHKDFRLYWHFAALVFLFLGLSQIAALVALLGPLGGLLQLLIPLATILFIMAVCHEDSVVSVKHDWLTRPIPGPTLLLAKTLFVLAAIILPSILGGIANNLYIGHSVSEALLTGISSGASGGMLTLIVLVMAFAALTASIRQAIIVLLSGFVVLALLSALVIRLAVPDEVHGPTGSSWVLNRSVELIVVLLAVAVLWVQYRYRHTKAARSIVGVALIAITIFSASMTWPHVFAVQKMFSPDASAAVFVQVQVDKGCFAAAVLLPDRSRTSAGAAAGIVPTLFSEEQRHRAGAGAIAFVTRLVRTSIPASDLLTVGHVALTYRIAGAAIKPAQAEPGPLRAPLQWTIRRNGTLALDDYWLLSRNDFARLAAAHDVETQIDYSLSLAAPASQAHFLADGRRASYPGIGYCSAKFDRATSVVDVDCFKAGVPPAQLVANLDGAPQAESKASGFPDFMPAVLNFWGGQRHTMQLHANGSEVPWVSVTAYQARAHFDRRFVVPGVFGGPVSQCPAP